MNGYVYTYRKLLDWEWFKDSHTLHVFMFLLLNANWTTSKWKGLELLPGQLITSVNSICIGTGLTPRSVRTCIKRLISTNEIAIKTTNKYTLVTIANWALYQQDPEKTTNKTTSEVTIKRQSNDNQTTTDEEYKKNKEGEEDIYMSDKPTTKKRRSLIPAIEEVAAYCKERNNGIDPHKFYDYYQSNGWMVGKNKMKDWKAAVRTWERNNKQQTSGHVSENTDTQPEIKIRRLSKEEREQMKKGSEVKQISFGNKLLSNNKIQDPEEIPELEDTLPWNDEKYLNEG